MSGPRGGAELSVVLPVDRFEKAARLIDHLRAQTVADRIELVVVAPSAAELDLPDDEGEGFAAVRTVETGAPLRYLFLDRAAGIRAATAPLVALAETHCFPDPGWAEALIAAHRGPWAAVGPAVANANPGTVSWASLLLDYGPWLAPVAGGKMSDVPGHNSCYKRELLLAYGDELEMMLEAEYVLHQDLRARGLLLYLEPAARTWHVNVSRIWPALVQAPLSARAFATARSKRWSPARRFLYAAASPLLPLVRLVRVLGHSRRLGHPCPLPRLMPWLALVLVAYATGELLGYALGGGAEAQRRMQSMDLERDAYLTARDSGALAASPTRSLPTAHG
jgi:hypothetical protein